MLSPHMTFIPAEALCQHLSNTVVQHELELWEINQKIHKHPELADNEVLAHDSICALMERLGYSVTRHAYGLNTAFEVEYGMGGRVVAYNAEYDALPAIGHACGHNLISVSSIAAFIATAEVIRAYNLEGRVRLVGTPAEESGGGKIDLIEANAYKDVDACLMGHPASFSYSPAGTDGLAAGTSLALQSVTVDFKGKAAHAGAAPWEGKNALDAVVAAYINISLLRQQITPTQRVHGVIKHGGDMPNIVPDTARVEYSMRAETAAELAVLCGRVSECFNGAAQATGCAVDIKWGTFYKDLRPNPTLCKTFANYMRLFGRNFVGHRMPGPPLGSSTDMGNVSYEVPSFRCMFAIETDDPHTGPHSPGFAKAAGSREAFIRALDCAKGIAAAGYEILTNEDIARQAWNDFW